MTEMGTTSRPEILLPIGPPRPGMSGAPRLAVTGASHERADARVVVRRVEPVTGPGEPGTDLADVEPGELAVALDELAVHEDGVHVQPAAAADQSGDHVADRPQVGVGGPDENDVGPLARGQRPDPVGQPAGVRAIDRRRLERIPGGEVQVGGVYDLA